MTTKYLVERLGLTVETPLYSLLDVGLLSSLCENKHPLSIYLKSEHKAAEAGKDLNHFGENEVHVCLGQGLVYHVCILAREPMDAYGSKSLENNTLTGTKS